MGTIKQVDVNSRAIVMALTLLATIAPAAAVLSPVLVGAYVTDMGFTPQQGGNIIAAELIGAALSSISTFFLISRVNWHKILYGAIAIMFIGYVVSCLVSTFDIFLIVRFVSGLALGTLMTMTIVVAGMMKDPERAFGFWSLGQIVFAVIGFALLPKLLPSIGLDGFYIFMAAAMALLILPARFMPKKGVATSKKTGAMTASKRMIAIGALAVFLFYTAIGSVWAYVERIADQAGLEADAIGYVLSISSLLGVVGAGAATWISTKYGRLLPSAAGYILVGLGILLLFDLETIMFYTLASLVFKFAWWFAAPYLLASVTSLDASGRVAILVNFVIACGLGLGHAIGAKVLTVAQKISGGPLDYNAVLIFGVICLSISFPLLLMVFRAHRNRVQSSVKT
ncbi:MAG: MFS transporter [Robiginitomaculum sp.]|nr:MFS transporter [Robiginitomaculum sp.]